MTRAFYRVVLVEAPTVDDFKSLMALGKAPLGANPVKRRMAEGVSVYATINQARRNARSFPSHGAYIAELIIEDDADLTFERTGGQGHHTIWGDPSRLLECVVSITPV